MQSFVSEIVGKNPWLNFALIIILAVLFGFALRWLIFLFFKLCQNRKRSALIEQLPVRLNTSLRFLLPLLLLYASFSLLGMSAFWYTAIEICVMTQIILGLVVPVQVVEEWVKEKFRIKTHCKAKNGKIFAKLRFLGSIAPGVIVLLSGLDILRNSFTVGPFNETRPTAAGPLGSRLALAAPKWIANMVTGYQLAFGPLISIEDEEVVEREIGTLEGVTLTYVMVKILDWRRLAMLLDHSYDMPFRIEHIRIKNT